MVSETLEDRDAACNERSSQCVFNIHIWVKNQDVLQAVPKVVRKRQNVVQEAKLKLPLAEGENEGNSKFIASNKFLESTSVGLCDAVGLCLTDNVECLGIDIRNPTKKLESSSLSQTRRGSTTMATGQCSRKGALSIDVAFSSRSTTWRSSVSWRVWLRISGRKQSGR